MFKLKLTPEQEFAIATLQSLSDKASVVAHINPYIARNIDYGRMMMMIASGTWLTVAECQEALNQRLKILDDLPTIYLVKHFAYNLLIDTFQKRADLLYLMREMSFDDLSRSLSTALVNIEMLELSNEIP